MKGTPNSKREFEAALKKLEKQVYVMKLYVAGNSRNSLNAVKNLKRLCERYLKGRYKMDIVDIYQQPSKSKEVLAAPMLVKTLPLPVRRLIGDMSKTSDVLLALSIKKQTEEGT